MIYMKITQEQRIKWYKENKCHICGKDTPHTHPNWMWLANPIPQTIKENQKVLKKIIG